jgi:GT2 family glycosyltransferase
VPEVTVIVPIFNGSAYLPAFFESLQQALPEHSQIIIVDDASTEDVLSLVPAFPRADSVTILRNESNLGYSVAVNRAFLETTGEVVIQLNTDLVLDPACITAMIDILDREPAAGVIGSKLVFPTTGLIQHIGLAFGNYSKPHIYFELPADHPLCSRTREVQITTGATVAISKRVLDILGPLEERYFNCNEDLEHCLIANKHGLKNFVSAKSVAYHWESQSGPARFVRKATSDALFWSRWADSIEVDLARFIDEAIECALEQSSHLDDLTFDVLDLTRGADQDIALNRIERYWPGSRSRVRSRRQMNNSEGRLRLPFLLPHWTMHEPTPFLYLVDRYRELEENSMWFETRRQIVADELIVDLRGVVVPTSQLRFVP